jgi:uncharacterized protein YecT (DUF1311 family)
MRLGIAALLVLFAACGGARAYDCRDARLPAEFVICSDPRLAHLVDRRDEALKAARERSTEEQRKTLNAEQRRWLHEYPQRCGVAASGAAPDPIAKATVACFEREIDARTTALRAYAAAPAKPEIVKTVASPPPAPAAKAEAAPKAEPEPAAATTAGPSAGRTYRLKFTFACRTPGKLAEVLAALRRNDFSFPLNQDDCLPIPEGRQATLLALDGKVAKVRLCSPEAGCIEVFADAGALETDGSAPPGVNPTASK